MIVSPTLSSGYHPWTWDYYQWPSMIQWVILFWSFGFFCLMLFFKLVPSVLIYEVTALTMKNQKL